MELLRAYLKQTKIFLIAFVFSVAASAAVVCLYQLPAEAVIYMAVLWLGAGAAAFLYGYVRYRQKAQTLCLVEKAPEINLDRLDETTDEVELLYREIIRKLDGMRMEVETDRHRSLEEMTDYYTMWAHQIKTPISAMRLILQTELGQMTEAAEVNREMADELFKVEQYVDMVLGYLKLDEQGTDYVFQRCSLDDVIRQSLRKFAGQFIRSKNRLVFDETGKTVITDEKWLAFVMEQLLSNALKYTREGEIHIYMENPDTLVIRDTGIGIAADDVPRVFEKGFTGYNGRADKKSTGIGLYLCRRIVQNLGYSISCESEIGKGTAVKLDFKQKEIVHAD